MDQLLFSKLQDHGLHECLDVLTPGRVACIPTNVVHHNLTIDAHVPGDLITDLQTAGQIGDPIYELNWLNSSIWEHNIWTYSTEFTLDSTATMEATAGSQVYLVFDGVKMGATVTLNGNTLGQIKDQFRRYTYAVDPSVLLQASPNKLEVVFDSSIDGRLKHSLAPVCNATHHLEFFAVFRLLLSYCARLCCAANFENFWLHDVDRCQWSCDSF